MAHVWFWTFWHWSEENFRDGALLRGPLHGIGSHWDEWFRHEASDADRRAIARAGQSAGGQRRFIAWLARCWAREATWRGVRPPVRFVLAQLSQVPPFDSWSAFARYRTTYGAPGVSAVVLAEGSHGEPADVRAVEVLLLPRDADTAAPPIVTEGFAADPFGLDAARRAAAGLLGGRGLVVLLTLWIAAGRRPYPRWLAATLVAGWAATAALLLWIALGPELGAGLRTAGALMLALWAALVLTAGGTAGVVAFGAWRLGRAWRARLDAGEVRLRMYDGLTLQGGSAGLAFCLGMLRAASRPQPGVAARSWLWQRVREGLRSAVDGWAATGVVAASGRIEAVVLAPKVRASLFHPRITHLLTPAQRVASGGVTDSERPAVVGAYDGARATQPAHVRAAPIVTALPPVWGVPAMRIGRAAVAPRLATHPCRHVAQAAMAVGGLTSRAQAAANVIAVLVSAVMLVALPDLRRIVWPAPVPSVVRASSSSSYELSVSLDTRRPGDFSVVFESEYWANRRAAVVPRDDLPPNAEVRLTRTSTQAGSDEENGTVWIERRRRFLGREMAPGERVGHYTLSYVSRIARE